MYQSYIHVHVVVYNCKQDSEATQRVDEWAEEFTEHCSLFSVATETPDPASSFSEIYHTLIHSPALETLLQLEHTYALAMENSLQAWKNARDMLEKRCRPPLSPKTSCIPHSTSIHCRYTYLTELP